MFFDFLFVSANFCSTAGPAPLEAADALGRRFQLLNRNFTNLLMDSSGQNRHDFTSETYLTPISSFFGIFPRKFNKSLISEICQPFSARKNNPSSYFTTSYCKRLESPIPQSYREPGEVCRFNNSILTPNKEVHSTPFSHQERERPFTFNFFKQILSPIDKGLNKYSFITPFYQCIYNRWETLIKPLLPTKLSTSNLYDTSYTDIYENIATNKVMRHIPVASTKQQEIVVTFSKYSNMSQLTQEAMANHSMLSQQVIPSPFNDDNISHMRSSFQDFYNSLMSLLKYMLIRIIFRNQLENASLDVQKIWLIPGSKPSQGESKSKPNRSRKRRTQRKAAKKANKRVENKKVARPLIINSKNPFVLVDGRDMLLDLHWIDFNIELDTEDETERKIIIYKSIPFSAYYISNMEDGEGYVAVKLLAMYQNVEPIVEFLTQEGYSGVNHYVEKRQLTIEEVKQINMLFEERNNLLRTEQAAHLTVSLRNPGNVATVRDIVMKDAEAERRCRILIEVGYIDPEEDDLWTLAHISKAFKNSGIFVDLEYDKPRFILYMKEELVLDAITIATNLGFLIRGFDYFQIDSEEGVLAEVNIMIRNEEIRRLERPQAFETSEEKPAIIATIPYGEEDPDELIARLYIENENEYFGLTKDDYNGQLAAFMGIRTFKKFLNKYPELGLDIMESNSVEEEFENEVMEERRQFLEGYHNNQREEARQRKEAAAQQKREERERDRAIAEERKQAMIAELRTEKASIQEETKRLSEERRAMEEERIRYEQFKSRESTEEEIAEEKRRISTLKDEELASEIDKVLSSVTEDWSTFMENLPKLKLYSGSIKDIREDYRLDFALVNNLDTIGPYFEEKHVRSIASCGNIDISTCKFFHILEETSESIEPLITCPYCDVACNDTNWLENHIRHTHKMNFPPEWNYAWAYCINHKKSRGNVGDYFKPKVCYKCSHCDFMNTSPIEVSKHIKKLHPHIKEAKAIRGVYGRESEVGDLLNSEVMRITFNPKPFRKPEFFRQAGSQTDKLLRGGSRDNTRGITNKGATCYMNSLLQSLAACKHFRDAIEVYDDPLSSDIKEVLSQLSSSDTNTPINVPDEIFERLGLDTMVHEDVEETMLKLLNTLDNENNSTLLTDTFRSIIGSTDTNPIPNQENLDINIIPMDGVDNNTTYKLSYLIDENLVGEKIVTSPKILAIKFARTELSVNTPVNGKEMYNVETEKTITLNGYKYETKAIIVHKGETASSGHYIAITKRNNTWYRADDSDTTIEKMPANALLAHQDSKNSNTKTAMVLLERVDVIPQSNNEIASRSEIGVGEDIYDILDNSEVEISSDEEEERWDSVSKDTPQAISVGTDSITAADQLEEITKDEAVRYYREMMEKLVEISEVVEEETRKTRTEEWENEVLSSKYFGCLADQPFEDDMLDCPISEIGMLYTKVFPKPNNKHYPCEFPGCNYNNIPSKRTKHWIECHGTDKDKIPELNLVNTYLGVLNMYGQAYLTDPETKEKRKIEKLIIECPECGKEQMTTNKNSWQNHIGRNHKDTLNKLIKDFGRYWGSEIIGFKTGNQFTPRDIIMERKVKACPYCDFCASDAGQVKSHISNVHKDHQTEIDKYVIDRIYSAKISTNPITDDNESVEEIVDEVNEEVTDEDEISGSDNFSISSDEDETIEDTPQVQEPNENQEENAGTHHEEENANPQSVPEENNNRDANNASNENAEVTINNGVNPLQAIMSALNMESITVDPVLFNKAVNWSSEHGEFEIAMPKLYRSKRKAIQELVSSHLYDESLPLLLKMINTNLGENDEERWIAINGAFSQTIHRLMEKIKERLHITGTRSNRTMNARENKLELTFARLSRTRAASSKAARLLREMVRVKESNSSIQTKENTLNDLMNRCIKCLREVDDEVVVHVFNHNAYEINSDDFNTLLNNAPHREALINYIDGALTNEMKECEAQRKKARATRVQELYSEDTKRAMRWYVKKEATPNCPLSANFVRDKLAQRWSASYTFEAPPKEENLWYTTFRLTREDKKKLEEDLTKPDGFQEVIKTRKPFSANGPEGIGYAVLQTNASLSAAAMMLISKAILEHGKLPSLWNKARTVMIYKKGDPQELKSWRPITINSAMYRIWTATLANSLQDINLRHPIFHRSQKGFIRGVDGCLEHTQTITELFNEANRQKKNLFMVTIDLEDAFGSIPHEYINEILDEMNFPDSIKQVIATSYREAYTFVDINGDVSSELRISRGVKQGCPLSPLIFNFCLNPLLNELEKTNAGFRVGKMCISAQAYADDLVLFAESREKMGILLDVVKRFSLYSSVKVNASKCHSISYVLCNNGRVFDPTPFSLGGDEIAVHTLASSVTYLGVKEAASLMVRHQGTEEELVEAELLINQIMKSDLKVNQKLDACRRFVIPGMNYTLTEGSPRKEDLDKLDVMIRTGIAKHIKTVPLPVSVCERDWKDGGLSLQPLSIRAKALRIKKLVALFNSPNPDTRQMFREFAKSEMKFRKIKNVAPGSESAYLGWKTDPSGKFIGERRGTSSITARANQDCVDLDVKLIYTDDGEYEMLAAKMDTMDGTDEAVRNPKEIARNLMRIRKNQAIEDSERLKFHGHCLYDLKCNPDSNFFIGNHTNHLSDKVISFAIAARSELLYTGWIAAMKKVPDERCPKCRYCGATGKEYTLGHALNGCSVALPMYTYRHNLVAAVIVKQIRKSYKGCTILQNRTVTVDGVNIGGQYSDLKPDIVIISPSFIKIIEVSCPFDQRKSDDGEHSSAGTVIRTALDDKYDQKMEKYEGLRAACGEKFGRECRTYVCIVSSLGAVYKKTVDDMASLFNWQSDKKRSEKRRFNRKLCSAALYGSYAVYYKLNPRPVDGGPGQGHPTREERIVSHIEDDAVGDVYAEDQDHPPYATDVLGTQNEN